MNNDYREVQEKAAAAATQQAPRGYGGLSGRDNEPAIREKGPVGKAQETLGYLSELEDINKSIRRKLYGPFPESGEANQKSPHEPSLEEMLNWICQRTAMAVGDAKNLLSKLD